MREPIIYTGGDLQTNAYLIAGKKSYVCIDAPQGITSFLVQRKIEVDALLLTHGHFDHIWEAHLIEKTFQCPVYIHPADYNLLYNSGGVAYMGLKIVIPAPKEIIPLPVLAGSSIHWGCSGIEFILFHIPGHSPGSVAFYVSRLHAVFCGDILFSGSIGRTDLPGGSTASLVEGIKNYLFSLPDQTLVYPGHGPSTTILKEKETNPYFNSQKEGKSSFFV
ncbi:MBL fold metallo-hydrolase [Candidatus Methylacidiphilum infernorum]|uniref:Zn-dependent hydrolase, glyoxylase family n=1 Tax=Methylacidiphilum infernorum (isolate V4) TaxID=481448 RepID=B3DUK0_METI4|nr:MBL fold metallo-hydrolase [Candidatus Methylacidiphilum infernorum]ACD83003.1 Zn-dependent hydrolase, glyoxylase family [Methylacidiphilum infernorum V4]